MGKYHLTQMRTMVLEYLPTKLVDEFGVNVGIHIPAPWSIWVILGGFNEF